MDEIVRHVQPLAERFQWVVLLALGFVFVKPFQWIASSRPHSKIPVVKIERRGFLDYLIQAHFQWMRNAASLITSGLEDFPKGCFQVPTSSGYKVVVPSRYAEELKSHPNLNFNESFAEEFFVDYPGFEPHRQGLRNGNFMPEVVGVKLTRSLGLVTSDLVEEASFSVHKAFGDEEEWKSIVFKQNLLDVVARLSSRVFLGKELCRNKDWLRITKEHTVDSFAGAQLLHMCPSLLRPLIYWFIPTCTRLRQQVRDARCLINPEVEKRHRRIEETLRKGEKIPKAADAIGWMVEALKGRDIDLVAAQLSLSIAAIHTTSEAMTNCILQLCETPEVVEPLREEIIKILTEEGWSKTSLYKLRLMDSFLKEVQRIRRLVITSMHRLVKKDITLSDGNVLSAGTRIMVSDDRAHDASIWPGPLTFDAARFLRLREQPGEENRHQFVTTTATLLGFGHG